MLPEPSNEQLNIIAHVRSGSNVVVDAVAGAGKTTTILHIAQATPDRTWIALTYNRKLKSETREKVADLELQNIEVHSYHAAAVKYYNSNAYVDTGIKYILDNNLPPKSTISFTGIILDEVQDITPDYYRFVRKLMQDNLSPSYCEEIPDFSDSEETEISEPELEPMQCVMFGDTRQTIYEFKGSDARYLRLAHDIMPGAFVQMPLHTSWRITSEIADFVNACTHDTRQLRAARSGMPVEYVIGNLYKRAFDVVQAQLEEYLPEQIFILAPTIKKGGNSPVAVLENRLVEAGHACFTPTDNNSDEQMKNRIVFSTFHRVKGLERDCVIVVGFDDSYFKLYARSFSPSVCPNTLYVAMTRARKKLILLHHNTNPPMDFIDFEIRDFARVRVLDQLRKSRMNKSKKLTYTIDECTSYLPVEYYKKISEISFAKQEFALTAINTVAVGSNGKLDVSKINVFAVLCILDYVNNERRVENCIMMKALHFAQSKYYSELLNAGQQMQPSIKISWFCKCAATFCAMQSGFITHVAELNYDWIEKESFITLLQHIRSILPNAYEINVVVNDKFTFENRTICVWDYTHILDKQNKKIWLLCAQDPTQQDLMFAAFLAWIWRRMSLYVHEINIISMRSGNVYTMQDIADAELETACVHAVNYKILNSDPPKISDAEFIEKNKI